MFVIDLDMDGTYDVRVLSAAGNSRLADFSYYRVFFFTGPPPKMFNYRKVNLGLQMLQVLFASVEILSQGSLFSSDRPIGGPSFGDKSPQIFQVLVLSVSLLSQGLPQAGSSFMEVSLQWDGSLFCYN